MAHPPGSNNIEKTKRTRIASNKVRDPTNDAELELPSHREARTQAQRAHAVQVARPPANTAPSTSVDVSVPSNSALSATHTATTFALSHKRSCASIADVDGDDNHGNAITNIGSSCESTEVPGPSKRPRFASPSTSPEPELKKPTLSAKEKTRDINEFFEEPETVSGKKSRRCKFCKKKQLTKVVVNEATTLRRHIESFHKVGLGTCRVVLVGYPFHGN
ncbi:hypothetical protein EDB85DRAFT_1895983 [Lactarius pseudohatsudake]|nr:hypothetical protein EDB85DRAFT_1895983 [Lactarius pseudohatsudake]